MTTLAAIIGGAAVVLILVGLVGGGFTFSGSVMPTVGKTARVLCFLVGGVMLTVAISLAFYDLSPPTPPQPTTSLQPTTSDAPQPFTPFAGYILIGDGYSAHVFAEPSSNSTVLTELPNGSPVEIRCTIQGESVFSSITGQTSSLWDGTPLGGFIPDVFVITETNQPTMPNC